MLLLLNFESDAVIRLNKDNSIAVEGHLTRGEYDTEKSLETLLEDALLDLDVEKALEIVAAEYSLHVDRVQDACKLVCDLCESDRDKLFNSVNEDLLDAISDESTGEILHPQTIKHACDLSSTLTPWIRHALLDAAIDLDLLDALTHPHKAALMRQALNES